MQSVSSRIWTRVALFISYDDNHYTTGTSKKEVIKSEWSYFEEESAKFDTSQESSRNDSIY